LLHTQNEFKGKHNKLYSQGNSKKHKSNKSQASDTAIVAVEETPSMTKESENNLVSFETSTNENVPKTSNTEPTPEAKISST
jgi:hypothetical protein